MRGAYTLFSACRCPPYAFGLTIDSAILEGEERLLGVDDDVGGCSAGANGADNSSGYV